MNKLEKTNKILESIKNAFNSYKTNFDMNKSSDELFNNFKVVLDKELKDYEILYDYIIGEESKNIDGITKNYYPKINDSIIMDISVKFDEVWVDVTRTFFVKKYTSKQKEAYYMIFRSIRNGESILKNGVSGDTVYNEVNKEFILNKMNLVHHAGHLISNEPVSVPEFIENENNIVKTGDIVAIESGIYKDFGIRLENDYLVLNDRCINLFEELMPIDIEEYVL